MTYEDACEMWQSEDESQELAFVVEAEQREAHKRFIEWMEGEENEADD